MFEQYEWKKIKVIRIALGILIPVIYTIIHIPPEVTMGQLISSGFVFLIIVYFAIRVLKYYKLI